MPPSKIRLILSISTGTNPIENLRILFSHLLLNLPAGIGLLHVRYHRRPKMRLMPVSICHYLTSSIDPKKPHTAGEKYKPDIAIARKDVVKSWAKWPMKNINSLQIEIYGVKKLTRYSGIPFLQLFRRNTGSEVCAL